MILVFEVVPGGGVEPPRGCPRRILSPLRLPVPPSRLSSKFLSATSRFKPYRGGVFVLVCHAPLGANPVSHSRCTASNRSCGARSTVGQSAVRFHGNRSIRGRASVDPVLAMEGGAIAVPTQFRYCAVAKNVSKTRPLNCRSLHCATLRSG